MKGKRSDVERVLSSPAGELRLFLFHGPDAAGSSELAGRVVAAAGADTERVSLGGAALKADPALLADEVSAFSLFGGSRVILVEGGGEDVLSAVEWLLEAPSAGNRVVIEAGVLRKGSRLLATVEASPLAMACASYVPEGRDADLMVIEMGRTHGLKVAPDVARRVAEAAGGDRAILANELAKFAMFLDACSDRQAALEHDILDALSAGVEEGDVSRTLDAVLDGDLATLDAEVAQLPGGSEVSLVRAVGRRMLLLARLRAEVERGSPVSAVMASASKSLFYKDKPAVERQLGRWSASRIASGVSYLSTAERGLKAQGSIGTHAVIEPLFAIAQAAARRRRVR